MNGFNVSNAPGAASFGLLQMAQRAALDAVFPPRCAGCGALCRQLFCSSCRAALHRIEAPFCRRCGLPLGPLLKVARCLDCRREPSALSFDLLRSAHAFEGPLRHAVHRFKYEDKVALAQPLGALLHEFLLKQSGDAPAGQTENSGGAANAIPLARLRLMAPVPLHPWRRRARGYNQSELLARELSKLTAVPLAASLLRRVRHTAPQVELNQSERHENVRDAFAVDERVLDEQTLSQIGSLEAGEAGEVGEENESGAVLLVDDVCTTGATLRECAAVLKAAGVKEVFALTLARQLAEG